MANFDSFWSENATKNELKQFNCSSKDAFELRTKHKNPFYTSSEDETEDEDGMKTPKIALDNYRKMGQKSMQKTFGGEPTKKPIYLQLLLDGNVPVDQLMSMEMPQELKDELRDWEAKFPNLQVSGKCAGECRHSARDMRTLRQEIARNIAEEHLWPELKSVLSSKRFHEEKQQKHKKTLSKSKSPKVHKKGATSATAVGTVKLPPINRNF
ncbi:hypothetical protein niasHT_017863 [Heterodera trifolii]|uniref:Uncharacterized protein n=1 Tax=Heterodera trifolii TaxID=157864 RepID=A0ABD2KSA9_9BILA